MSRIWKTCTELLLLTPKRKLKTSEGVKGWGEDKDTEVKKRILQGWKDNIYSWYIQRRARVVSWSIVNLEQNRSRLMKLD